MSEKDAETGPGSGQIGARLGVQIAVCRPAGQQPADRPPAGRLQSAGRRLQSALSVRGGGGGNPPPPYFRCPGGILGGSK